MIAGIIVEWWASGYVWGRIVERARAHIRGECRGEAGERA